MEDKELERIASGLGAGAEEVIDVERVAQRVIDRLRREPAEAAPIRRWRRAPMVRAAAAIGVLLAATLLTRRVISPDEASTDSPVPLALEELSDDDLTEVLDSLTYEGPVHPFVGAGLHDLDETQLRDLLAAMEI